MNRLELVGIFAVLAGLIAVSIAAWMITSALGLAVAGSAAMFVGVVAVLAANRTDA